MVRGAADEFFRVMRAADRGYGLWCVWLEGSQVLLVTMTARRVHSRDFAVLS